MQRAKKTRAVIGNCPGKHKSPWICGTCKNFLQCSVNTDRKNANKRDLGRNLEKGLAIDLGC